MTSCHAIILSIKAKLFISIDQADNYNFANLTVYQRIIGKLMYLVFGTWPDISFVIGLLSQYNSDSKIKHFCIVKQLLYYLKKTINLEIVWRSDLARH